MRLVTTSSDEILDPWSMSDKEKGPGWWSGPWGRTWADFNIRPAGKAFKGRKLMVRYRSHSIEFKLSDRAGASGWRNVAARFGERPRSLAQFDPCLGRTIPSGRLRRGRCRKPISFSNTKRGSRPSNGWSRKQALELEFLKGVCETHRQREAGLHPQLPARNSLRRRRMPADGDPYARPTITHLSCSPMIFFFLWPSPRR